MKSMTYFQLSELVLKLDKQEWAGTQTISVVEYLKDNHIGGDS